MFLSISKLNFTFKFESLPFHYIKYYVLWPKAYWKKKLKDILFDVGDNFKPLNDLLKLNCMQKQRIWHNIRAMLTKQRIFFSFLRINSADIEMKTSIYTICWNIQTTGYITFTLVNITIHANEKKMWVKRHILHFVWSKMISNEAKTIKNVKRKNRKKNWKQQKKNEIK